MIEEIELKLAINKSDIEQFKLSPLLATTIEPIEYQDILTIYYDTPDFTLKNSGFALRIRKLDDDYTQTIKTAANKKETELNRRIEYNHKVSGFTPNYDVFPDANLRQDIIDGDLGSKLCPLFSTEFKRINWQLQMNETRVLVSLDQGVIKADTKQEEISEVEIELIEGNEQDIFKLADILKQTVELSAFNQSKSSRGYKLIR